MRRNAIATALKKSPHFDRPAEITIEIKNGLFENKMDPEDWTDAEFPKDATQLSDSPHIQIRLVFFSLFAGFLCLGLTIVLPRGMPFPKTIFGILGSALISPIMCLFFKVYHAIVPQVFRPSPSRRTSMGREIPEP
jgi:hypothetical protein